MLIDGKIFLPVYEIDETSKTLTALGFKLDKPIESAFSTHREPHPEETKLSKRFEGMWFIIINKLPDGWKREPIKSDESDRSVADLILDENNHLRVWSNPSWNGRDGEWVEHYGVCPRFYAYTGQMPLDNPQLFSERPDNYMFRIYDGEIRSSIPGRLVKAIPETQFGPTDYASLRQLRELSGGDKLIDDTNNFVKAALDKFLPDHKNPLAYWGQDCSEEIGNLVKAFQQYRDTKYLPQYKKIMVAGASGDPKLAS